MCISVKTSSLCPLIVQKLDVLCFCSLPTFLLLNVISFLLVHHHGSKMLRSESNSSITQSPIGWQISHFLTMLHEPDSGMCVCTSECVVLGVGPAGVCVSVWALVGEWMTYLTWCEPAPIHKPTVIHLQLVLMHAVVCMGHITCWHFLSGTLFGTKWLFSSLSMWRELLSWASFAVFGFAWQSHKHLKTKKTCEQFKRWLADGTIFENLTISHRQFG